ncbi:MAG: alpha-L-rhamnosidase [Enterococcus sp.]|uniref:alpha-L-rhamnosidase n=1 Tax=Enterococcus sp. TaxID=35783 RepID=UPI002588AAEB|nr:alpha-L-rhamnosidase [Enterococcus sp.]MDK2843698.1 alpha-L-rhamnosidase [Enterococcus sp.]
MKLVNLRCDFLNCPLAVTNEKPIFSWEIESDESNSYQKSVQISVIDEQENIVWKSKKQESGINQLRYQGAKLQSGQRYYFEVIVIDNRGESASAKSYFETGYMSHADWKAHWIEPIPLPQLPINPLSQAQDENQAMMAALMRGEQVQMKLEEEILNALPLEPYDPTVRFYKQFSCQSKIKKARLAITAHGIYEAKINGQAVTDTFLNPGFTTYDKRIKYQIYDVTELLTIQNNFEVTVADGWYKGKIALGRGCEYGEIPGLLAQLEITLADGSKQIIVTDHSWQFSFDGPIRCADLFLGEVYDANQDLPFDIRNSQKVIVKDIPDNHLEADNQPGVRILHEIPAKKVWQAPNGDTLVDFGQNLAGFVKLTIKDCQPNEEITLEHGEVLDEKGNFYYVFSDTNKAQKDVYICRGTKEEVYQPRFTYHGFRYLRITGGDNWKKEQFIALAISSNNRQTGEFQCDNADLNQLQQNIYWSQISNNITIPTDCPTREKAGWTGDVVVYGPTALFNQDMYAFYKDWLKSIRIEQDEKGHVLNTVPLIKNYVQQTFNGSLGWGDVILTLPWQLYQTYGDISILADNYEAMGKWIHAMQQAAYEMPNDFNTITTQKVDLTQMNERQLDNQHYLINTGFHFGDWIIPSVVNDQGFTDGPTSSFLTMNYADTSLLVSICDLYAKISELLGQEDNAQQAADYAKRVREAFTEEYVTEYFRLGQEMQGNYILALKNRMVPENIALIFAQRLNELIINNGYRLDTGFMSTPHLLDVLLDYGYQDTAWKVLFQTQCPSWLYEVKRGATTMWENWDALRPDGKVHNCSFNHYAFGCVGDFLYRRVLGIQNQVPGYEKILLSPNFTCPLNEVSGHFDSVRGRIEFHWQRLNNQYLISGKIPANIQATIQLPNNEMRLVGNGVFKFII